VGSQKFQGVKRIHLLDIPIDIFDPDDLPNIVRAMLADGEKHQIVLLDIWGFMTARYRDSASSTLHEASLVIPISKMILQGAHFLHHEIRYRPMPFEFIIRLLGIIENQGQTLYLIGSRPVRLHTIAGNLRASFPAIRIVGRYAGYYRRDQEQDVKTAIKKAAPALLLAGHGLPGKDRWLFENKRHFAPGIYLWNGRCMDIFSGKRKKPSKKTWEAGTYWIPDLFRHRGGSCGPSYTFSTICCWSSKDSGNAD
jgi:N-acetylglucosaminyldiphosphoundecaprenol N-acetyl-beta-D-mannosaminyltransferase